jgi:hypothetical protein
MSESIRAQDRADAVVDDKPRRRGQAGRSPNYPYFDLEKSLSRARQLFERERLHATPVKNALQYWGYTNASGKGGMALSSLKQFGLLDDVGRGEGRRVQLTTLAHDVLNNPHESQHKELLREAALTPDIHQEMWEEFGVNLPSDSSLAWTLTKDRNFTRTGADEFIRQWRKTMEYADLGDMALTHPAVSVDQEQVVPTEAGGLDTPRPAGETSLKEWLSRSDVQRSSERGARSVSQWPTAVSPQSSNAQGSTREVAPVVSTLPSYAIPIALSGRPPVQITGAFPLSETEWNQFIAVLTAMKPSLAGDAANSESAGGSTEN